MLLTDSGIEQFILEDAYSIAFVDPELQKVSPPRYRDLPLTARTDIGD